MPATSPCPDRDTLHRLLLGQVAGPEGEQLAVHLEECGACCASAQNLVAEDTLSEAARVTAGIGDDPEGELVRTLIARLRRLAPFDGESSSEATAAEPGSVAPPLPAAEETYSFLAPAQEPGELGRLGGYRVLEVLGQGGMGMVFRAQDVQLQRSVALKVMKPSMAATPRARQRFLREAQAMAALKSDHVVTVYQVGEEGSVPFLAMEFLQGETLDQWLRRDEKPSIAQVLRLACEVTQGLAAAHEQGLIHRDVKPPNIWLETPTGRAKLLDFGVARAAGEDVQLTQSGALVGTPSYMAPEQARGDQLDSRADLFALGVVLYRLCTGRLPFQGKTTMGILTSLALDKPQPVAELSPQTPPAFAALIMDLLAKDPTQRPESAQAVLARLTTIQSQLAAGLPGPAAEAGLDQTDVGLCPLPAPPSPLVRRAPRGRHWLPLALAAAVLVPVLGPAIYFAPTILRIATNKGELVVEVDDPDVEVRVKQGTVVIERAGSNQWIVAAGDGVVEVTDKQSGDTLAVREFTLRRGGKEVVRVQVKALADARKAEPRGNPAVDRSVAAWVLQKGGGVLVGVDGKPPLWIQGATAQLPQGPIQLTGIALVLSDVRWSDLREQLRDLSAVGTLDLLGVQLTDADLEQLASLPLLKKSLQTLRVGSPIFSSAGLACLKQFDQLNWLEIHMHDITTGGMRHLGAIATLAQLLLFAPVSDDGLRELRGRKLTRLAITSDKVTDAGLEHLRDMPLVMLTMDKCAVTDAGLAHLKAWPELRSLALINTKVTDAGLAMVAALPKVVQLSLTGPFTDKGAAHLRKMKGLVYLAIIDARLTDAGVAMLAELKALVGLTLQSMPITDAGLQFVKGLPQLEALDILHTKVTAEGLKKLAAALPRTGIVSDHGTFAPGGTAVSPAR
jgi:predicted Ser/Thr protein kinase